MPTRGSLTSEIPAEAPPEVRAWAEKCRTVYSLLPERESMEYWADRLYVHLSTLSRYLNGSRRPEERSAARLYNLAAVHQQELGNTMPFPLDEFLALLQAAAGRRSGRPTDAPVPVGAAAGATPLPPVPRQQPDRQDGAAAWEGAGTVQALVGAGRLRDAHVLLAETGRTGTPAVVCDAAASLRQCGLGDAADTLLLAAGRRSDRERTAILSALNRGRRFQDMEVVLRAAEDLLGAAA